MKIYHIAFIVFCVGLLGGLPNAPLSGYTTLLPGLLVTTFVVGVVSWGLYGANAGTGIDGKATITVAALAGARWLTNEADKNLLTKSTALAAAQPKSEKAAQEVLHASPEKTLEIIRALQ